MSCKCCKGCKSCASKQAHRTAQIEKEEGRKAGSAAFFEARIKKIDLHAALILPW
jgi:hypothetical protein